jgi:hypothetical protein
MIGTLSYHTLSNQSLVTMIAGTYRYPVTVTTYGTTVLSATAKYGAASLFCNSVGCVAVTSAAAYAFGGTGDYTYEGHFRFLSSSSTQFLFDQRPTASSYMTPVLYFGSGALNFYLNGGIRIAYTWTPNTTSFYHIALVRSSGVTKIYVDGTPVGASYTDANTYVQGGDINIGCTYTRAGSFWTGYIDNFRVSNMARYTTTFTPPSEAFKNDTSTLFLLPFDTNYNDYVS